jgi:hypothetical protein
MSIVTTVAIAATVLGQQSIIISGLDDFQRQNTGNPFFRPKWNRFFGDNSPDTMGDVV